MISDWKPVNSISDLPQGVFEIKDAHGNVMRGIKGKVSDDGGISKFVTSIPSDLKLPVSSWKWRKI